MRKYASVAPTFWTRGSGKKLRGHKNGQIVALYLMSAPATNMIGLFHLTLPNLCHETGLSIEDARDGLKKCAEKEIEIAFYDEADELVWVPALGTHQLGEALSPNDRKISALRRELAPFRSHRFYREFMERYGAAYHLEDEPRKGHAGFVTSNRMGHPESENGARMPPGPDPVPVPVPAPSHAPDPVGSEQLDLSPPEPLEPPDEATEKPSGVQPSAPSELQRRARLWADAPNGEWRSDRQAALFEAPNPQLWPEVVALERLRGEVFPGAPPRDLRTAGDERVVTVLARFAEGYTSEELAKAVRGAARDDLIDRSPQHQNLMTILRDAAQVDRFCALADAPESATRRKLGRGPVQASHGVDVVAPYRAEIKR